jgi:hypothetical protein
MAADSARPLSQGRVCPAGRRSRIFAVSEIFAELAAWVLMPNYGPMLIDDLFRATDPPMLRY